MTAAKKRRRPRCTKADHQRLRDDDEAWSQLERKPDWIFDDEILEQANCPKCGSTLARRKKP